ncbi:hypothetical protein K470DRAFT_265572 [Piedraia hortae CBS 480.64]|uniref:Uncharacterized protein n=1 Tax=Piedraia hortae CBS 480.64 TaxID=1314780 RepID=A0A6A7BX41_9PEZI|nr:hypothetical protein K470DRAFT_265572 [Piedraia hortae CBS 480.64]
MGPVAVSNPSADSAVSSLPTGQLLNIAPGQAFFAPKRNGWAISIATALVGIAFGFTSNAKLKKKQAGGGELVEETVIEAVETVSQQITRKLEEQAALNSRLLDMVEWDRQNMKPPQDDLAATLRINGNRFEQNVENAQQAWDKANEIAHEANKKHHNELLKKVQTVQTETMQHRQDSAKQVQGTAGWALLADMIDERQASHGESVNAVSKGFAHFPAVPNLAANSHADTAAMTLTGTDAATFSANSSAPPPAGHPTPIFSFSANASGEDVALERTFTTYAAPIFSFTSSPAGVEPSIRVSGTTPAASFALSQALSTTPAFQFKGGAWIRGKRGLAGKYTKSADLELCSSRVKTKCQYSSSQCHYWGKNLGNVLVSSGTSLSYTRKFLSTQTLVRDAGHHLRIAPWRPAQQAT